MNTNGTVRQRSINVAPEVWEKFKAQVMAEGESPAARLGELITQAVGTSGSAASMTLSTSERQHIWYSLNNQAAVLPLRSHESVALHQDLMVLRDRFADAFDPPKTTIYTPRRS